MSLGAELQRKWAEAEMAILQKPVRSVMFELKVMEPAAFKFEYCNTTRNTTELAGAAFWSFDAFKE